MIDLTKINPNVAYTLSETAEKLGWNQASLRRKIVRGTKDPFIKEVKPVNIGGAWLFNGQNILNALGTYTIKPFKIYFLTHSLLADFQEKGGACSMEAEEGLFLALYDLEKEDMTVEDFLKKIKFDFGLNKRDLKRAYIRFLDYVKYK